MAAGSHDENGTCALLVIAANIRSMATVRGRALEKVNVFH